MKAKVWVLATVLADENAPALPAVFADEAEAWAKYDEMIRAVNRPRRLTHIGVQLGPTRGSGFTFSMNGLSVDTVGQHCTPMVGLRPRRFTVDRRIRQTFAASPAEPTAHDRGCHRQVHAPANGSHCRA
jgi:hypothetical protein